MTEERVYRQTWNYKPRDPGAGQIGSGVSKCEVPVPRLLKRAKRREQNWPLTTGHCKEVFPVV